MSRTEFQNAITAFALTFALFLGFGCVPVGHSDSTTAGSLAAQATQAEHIERAEKAKLYDALSAKAKTATSSKEMKDAWAAGLHEARRKAYQSMELSVDAAGSPDGKYDPVKTSQAFGQLATGVRKAGK